MHPTLQEVLDLIEKIERKIQEVTEKVNRMLDLVPAALDWIVDRLREGWDDMVGKLNEFWQILTEPLRQMGDPIGLSRAANSWNLEVGEPTMSQAREVDAGQLLADDSWTGTAADQYKSRIPQQKSTLEDIRNQYTTQIADCLDAVQTGIIVFWVAIAGALATLIGGIVGGLASAATIFGLPATPFIIGAAVVVAIGAIGGGILILASQCNSATTTLTTARSAGLNSWPELVS